MPNQLKTFDGSCNLDELCEVLSSDGVFKIDNYVYGPALKSLHDDVMNKCETEGGHYEFGRNYRGGHLSEYPPDSLISKIYNESWMKDLYNHYSGSLNGYGKNVFATHDYKYEGELARNGWLHFDRNWCLKFFIYLTDIDESSGAFSCSIGSKAKGAELRKAAWSVKEYEDVKNRIEIDYPELLKEYPPQPIEAKAGTLIVFDTDTFHRGGKVEPDNHRLVVRLHCG
jgi:hypothetical protein